MTTVRSETAGSLGTSYRTRMIDPATGFKLRYVNVPCPSGQHQRSMLAFRSHTEATLFCIPCEEGWTQPVTHPELRGRPIDVPR